MKKPSACMRLILSIVGTFLLVGCQGAGHTINFEPHALTVDPTSVATVEEQDLTILVNPFKDARPEKTRLGSRTHFWGGVTHFNAWDGNIAEGMANLAVRYLQQRPWKASRTATGSTDVTLDGTLLSLTANAKTGFGFTDIVVDMRVRFEALNAVDDSTVRMVLGAKGSDRVATFDPQDVDRLINVVAKDLYQQLFQDLKVQNKAFHLRPEIRP